MSSIREGGILWFAKRRTLHVSGSSLASVLGVSPWKSRWKLYLEKTGVISEKRAQASLSHPATQERLAHGRYWEPYALAQYEESMAVRGVVASPGLHVSPRLPTVAATPDAWHPESRTVIEIKCPSNLACSERTWDQRMVWDRPPAHYIAQTLLEAHVMGAARIHFVCYLAPEEDEPWRLNVLEYALPRDLWDEEIWPEILSFSQQIDGVIGPPPKRLPKGHKEHWTRKLEDGIDVTASYYFSGEAPRVPGAAAEEGL